MPQEEKTSKEITKPTKIGLRTVTSNQKVSEEPWPSKKKCGQKKNSK